MNVRFRGSFLKDIKVLTDRQLKDRIKATIAEVEGARALQDIRNLKKLRGSRSYYRIRVGEYRIGLVYEDGSIIFVRCLHRRDIYKYLP